MKAIGLKALPIVAACALLFSITGSEASIFDVSGTYTNVLGAPAATGTFSGTITITGSVYSGGDVTTVPTTGTNFGEFKNFLGGDTIDLTLGNTVTTNVMGLFLPPASSLVGSASFTGLITTEEDDLLANVAGTATPTPLPTALPLFATGLGGLGLLGWRRRRKAQA